MSSRRTKIGDRYSKRAFTTAQEHLVAVQAMLHDKRCSGVDFLPQGRGEIVQTVDLIQELGRARDADEVRAAGVDEQANENVVSCYRLGGRRCRRVDLLA